MGSWWIMSTYESGGPLLLGTWLFWVIFSIVLHELAHGWTAIHFGDRTPVVMGHMTWNPIVHMGAFSLIALLLVGIAWGSMPVDRTRLHGRHADLAVSLAGPLMNVTIGLACALALGAWLTLFGAGTGGLLKIDLTFATNMTLFLGLGCGLNFVLAIFNMVPVPPLDGSRVLTHLYRPLERFYETEAGQFVAVALFMLLYFFASSWVAGAGMWLAAGVIEAVLWMMG